MTLAYYLRRIKIFALDIETLGIESTSVILSIGLVYVKDTTVKNYQEMLKDSLFVKLNAKEQISKYGRTVDKDTLTWWKKQGEIQRKHSYIPSDKDVSVVEAVDSCIDWVKSKNDDTALVWVRGSMDGPCMDNLFKSVLKSPLFGYNRYRDVRTAIDILYPNTSKNGYVEVDPEQCPDWSEDLVVKHHPVSDCLYDLCMLRFGKL